MYKLLAIVAMAFWTTHLSLAQPDTSQQALLQSFWGEWTNKPGDVRFYYSADTYFGVIPAQCSTSILKVLVVDARARTVVARIAPEKGEEAADFKLVIEPNGVSGWIANRTKFLAHAGALRDVSPQKSEGMRLDDLPFTDFSPIRKLSNVDRPSRNDCQRR